ncbi:MAG: sulfatase, partial [Candidatus Binatia bacterium]
VELLPLAQAIRDLRAASPQATEIVAGPGLSPGAVSHYAAPATLTAVAALEAPVGAVVRLASPRPSTRDRAALVRAIGERVLDRYGALVGDSDDEGGGIAWSVYRQFSLRLAEGAPRPNIAIVSVDTLRADHLPVYGYARDTSPRLRRWVEDAKVYERAVATAPETAPSFASLLTGRLPSGHGVRANYHLLDPGNWTLARILGRAGYETAAFVSSFVLTASNSGFEPGFARYDQELDSAESRRKNRPIRLAPSLARSVLQWLDERRRSARPWFLWVHAIDPHGPYEPLEEFRELFDDDRERILPRGDIPDYQWTGSRNFYDYVDAYDAEIRQTDEYLGRILERLDVRDSDRPTIVIFVADHGEGFGEHGYYFKHGESLHQEELHVPLVLKDSANPGGGRHSRPVSLVQVVPTLLERLGIETDLPLDAPPLRADGAEDPLVVSEFRPGVVSVYRHPQKLIVDESSGERSATLYDFARDPLEAEPAPLDGGGEALLAVAVRLLENDPLHSPAGRE